MIICKTNARKSHVEQIYRRSDVEYPSSVLLKALHLVHAHHCHKACKEIKRPGTRVQGSVIGIYWVQCKYATTHQEWTWEARDKKRHIGCLKTLESNNTSFPFHNFPWSLPSARQTKSGTTLVTKWLRHNTANTTKKDIKHTAVSLSRSQGWSSPSTQQRGTPSNRPPDGDPWSPKEGTEKAWTRSSPHPRCETQRKEEEVSTWSKQWSVLWSMSLFLFLSFSRLASGRSSAKRNAQ